MREGGGGNSCMKSINYSCCAPLLSCAFSLSDFLLYLLGSPCSNLLLNGTSCFFFREFYAYLLLAVFFCFFSDCHLLIPRSCLPLLMVN